MRFILLLLAAAACLLPAQHAHSQIGIYGQFSMTHEGSTNTWYKGSTFGGYGNIASIGPIHLGADIRGTFGSTAQYHYRDVLFGPRLEVRPRLLPVKPYIQAAVGFGGTRYTGFTNLGSHYSNKLQYGVIGGADYTVLPHIDLRIPEIRYTRMSAVSGYPNPPKINVVGIGFGLVLRLP